MIQCKTEIKNALDTIFDDTWNQKEFDIPDDTTPTSSKKIFVNDECIKIIMEWKNDDTIFIKIKKI